MLRVSIALSLACLIGLIAARMTGLHGESATFSWTAFAVGFGITALAFALERAVPTERLASNIASPLDKHLIQVAVASFVLALSSFALLLYTNWSWPRFAVQLSVVAGAMCVVVGSVSRLFRR
jgi:archaellum biogenesis protein FlaJ (TadC family)